MSSGNVPASLKSIGKYLSSAKRYELEGDYITSAYCLIFAAQLVVKQRTGDDPKSTALLEDLMQQAKEQRAKIDPEIKKEACQAHIAELAYDTFFEADSADVLGMADINTARTFYNAKILFEVLQYFGPLDDESRKKLNFSRHKSVEISKAVFAGKKPTAGGPNENPELLKQKIEEYKQIKAKKEAEAAAAALEAADTGEDESSAPDRSLSQSGLGAHSTDHAPGGPSPPATGGSSRSMGQDPYEYESNYDSVPPHDPYTQPRDAHRSSTGNSAPLSNATDEAPATQGTYSMPSGYPPSGYQPSGEVQMMPSYGVDSYAMNHSFEDQPSVPYQPVDLSVYAGQVGPGPTPPAESSQDPIPRGPGRAGEMGSGSYPTQTPSVEGGQNTGVVPNTARGLPRPPSDSNLNQEVYGGPQADKEESRLPYQNRFPSHEHLENLHSSEQVAYITGAVARNSTPLVETPPIMPSDINRVVSGADVPPPAPNVAPPSAQTTGLGVSKSTPIPREPVSNFSPSIQDISAAQKAAKYAASALDFQDIKTAINELEKALLSLRGPRRSKAPPPATEQSFNGEKFKGK
ncbi:hypothetical protein NDN08_002333 [Rhodosorus marinus]|uniref:Vta1/callose synthase N-terminal domain-containing protein n=1 Tax=Rhodosorus marinus TaxID=101924 RepID=A0AAV8UXI8_9RHOD|nr:hypothetical protein NDN08_002333 [Rhodosorus marinus]